MSELTFLTNERPVENNDELTKVCICCLERDGTFVNLSTCKHFEVLKKLCSLYIMEQIGHLVCYYCHNKLQSILDFTLRAEESFHLLWSYQYSENKVGFTRTSNRAPKLEEVKLFNQEINCEYQPELLTDWMPIKPEQSHAIDYHEIISGCWLSNSNCPPAKGVKSDQKIKVPLAKIKTEFGKIPNETSVVKNIKPKVSKISTQVTNYHIEVSGVDIDTLLDNEAPSEFDTDDIPLASIKREVEIEVPKLQKHKTVVGRRQSAKANIKKAAVSKKTSFFCTECGKGYSDKKTLRRHNLTMHNHQKLCTPKRYTFEDYAEIINLITLTHEELMSEREAERNSEIYLQRLYRCDLCIVSFNHTQMLRNHNVRRHQITENSLQCGICNSVFAAQYHLKAHEKKHYTRYECTVCQKRYSSLTSIVDHINKLHESKSKITFSCPLCDYTTWNHRSFAYHSEKHKGRSDCQFCGSTFITKGSLRKHMLAAHGKSKESTKFRCEQCNKTYSSRYYLRVHNKAKHAPSTPATTDITNYFYCEACNIFFINDKSLKYHLKFHKNHRSEDDKRFTCDICNKTFFTKNQVRQHITFLHLNIKSFPCPQCPKRCETKSSLNKHVRYVHEKIRPPRNKICDYCGKGFQTVGILRSHIRRHTGERPYQCAYCPSTFAQSGALYTHNKLLHSQTRKRKY